MAEIPVPDSLVLYKSRPARVLRITDKVEIECQGGATHRVRPKDVVLLHPGPLSSLGDLGPRSGDVESAWEILYGGITTVTELAELLYGDSSPASVWSAWELVADGLYFQGTPQQVTVRSRDDLERDRTEREAAESRVQAWQAFVTRLDLGSHDSADEPFLQEVQDLALGRTERSRVMKKLGRQERPETAHALMLKSGYWDERVNPYPARLKLARGEPDTVAMDLPEEPRIDLTHLDALAIDDEGNRDPDDALSIEGSRLWIHVADVAARVPPDSAADIEARARGATLYAPEGIVPMLPSGLAEEAGMGLKDVSPALSFGLDLDSHAQIRDMEVVRSWVRVRRLTYAQAECHLDESPLRDLWLLAEAYRERRSAQGAVFLELPEVSVRVQGGDVVIRPVVPTRSRRLVTQAMLMAGEGAARFAIERGIPFPFATQPPPDTPQTSQTLAGMYAYRKKLRRRQMKSVPERHAGLGLEAYSQATSPLRRYLDLVAHQQLRAHLRGEEPLDAAQVLERVGCAEAASGLVRTAERLSNRHWTLVHLKGEPGWAGEGILVERRGGRGTVLIPSLGLEAEVGIRGDPALDDSIELRCTGVDLPELQAYFIHHRP